MLAVDQHGNLVLGMQAFAVGTVAVGSDRRSAYSPQTSRAAFRKQSETPDELTAQLQIGIVSHKGTHPF